MIAATDELRALVGAWAAPPRKRKPARGSKKANDSGDYASAQRLAKLAAGVAVDDALIEALGRASETYADDRDIRRAHVRALADADRIGEAIAEFEERLQHNADDADDLVDVASLYERASRIDLAIDRLRRAVDIFVAAQDIDRAIPAARRLIALEPRSLESATDLVALLRRRDPALLVEGVEHLADVYRERGKLGQEAAACRELIELRPKRRDVRERLVALYVQILEIDPSDETAWEGLSVADAAAAARLRERLLPEQEIAPAEPAHATAAHSHQGYAMRKARELIDAGDLAGATLCLERVVRTDPQPQHRLLLARCYRGIKRDDLAAEQALRAIAQSQASHEEDAVDEALVWLCEALPSSRGPLADALFLNHRPESADNLYEELRSLWDEADEEARRLEESEGSA